MLRENEDVFQVFSQNVHKLKYENCSSFAETLVSFLFNDMTQSQTSNSRFIIVMKAIIKNEVEQAESPDQLLKGMSEMIFKQLIKQSDARRYITYLFKSKYDRIDFNYLEKSNICKIFEYLFSFNLSLVVQWVLEENPQLMRKELRQQEKMEQNMKS